MMPQRVLWFTQDLIRSCCFSKSKTSETGHVQIKELFALGIPCYHLHIYIYTYIYIYICVYVYVYT